MKRLSDAQRAMMRSIAAYGDPTFHLSGGAQIGGGEKTLRSLIRLGLVCRPNPGKYKYALTSEAKRTEW